MRRLGSYAAAVVVACAVFVAASRGLEGVARAFATNLVQLLASFAATVAATRTARATGRATWWWFAAGAASFTVGQACWTAATLPWGDVPTQATLFDLPFLAVAPCFVAGTVCVRRARASRAELTRVAADGLIFATSGAIVLGQLVLGSGRLPIGTLDWASALADPILDFALLAVAASMLPTTDATGRHRLSVATVAFALLTASDIAFVYAEIHDGYTSGSVADLGWVAGFVVLAVLAREVDRSTAMAPDPTRTSSLIAVGFPYAPVAALAALGAWQANNAGVTRWTALGTTAVVLMITVRELVLHNDVLRLQERLAAEVAASDKRQAQYWNLVEAAPLPVVLTQNARWRYVNPAGRRMFGWTDRSAPLGAVVDDEILSQFTPEKVERARSEGTALELTVTAADGERRDLECHITFFEAEDGPGSQVIAQDVTERRFAERELARQERRWRSLVENASDLVLVISRTGTVLEATPASGRILGVSPAAIAGASASDLVHPEDLAAVVQAFAGAMVSAGAESSVVFRARRSDGSYLWMEARARNLLDDGAVGGIVCNLRDIDDQKRALDAVRHQAMHDNLTGLANRRALLEHLAAASCDRDADIGLLLMDLDGFKDVNDGLGHEVGDLLLVEVARRLVASVRAGDLVVRLGGDEFAIVLRGVADRAAGEWVAAGVLDRLRRPFRIGGVTLTVDASIGVVSRREDGDDPGTLLRRADVAMYHAKRSGGGVAAYDASLDADSAARLALAGELRDAVDAGRIGVVFQPKVDASTGRVVGAEALARWGHPTLGQMSPAQFIALAEQAGLIGPLTDAVLEGALGACRTWRSEGFDVGVAVNLSARLLADRGLDARVAAAIARAQLPASCVTLEITESAFADDVPAVVDMVGRLHAIGVRLSIDDFGTGYSSMAYLKRLPLDELKIDRAFVLDLDERDRAIVRAVIELGHQLGLTIVAEGVETEQALADLAALGCDVVQGYHVLRPTPVAGFIGWLASRQPSFTA